MKKISCLVVLVLSLVAIAIGLTSCGTSSLCKIGMDKSECLALFEQDMPSYNINGEKYYWYDDTFYEVFTKYDIDLKSEEDQLSKIQEATMSNVDLRTELSNLSFRYRFCKFENDKLTEFYYDFDHRFDLTDDYACFKAKEIEDFALSKRKLEYYIEERDRMEGKHKNKTCYYIRICDYENLSYTINFTDGTLFKGRLQDAITNDTNITVNNSNKLFQILFYLGLSNYSYTTFNPAEFKETEILKNIDYECCFRYAKEFSGIIDTASYGGYIDSKNRVVEWRTKLDYLPDYVNKDELVGEMTTKTVQGVKYNGYILNPYYEVVEVTKKDAKEIKLQDGVQIIKTGALCNLTNIYELVIPEGTKTIEDGAINNNPNLVGVQIPASVEEISENNFIGCPKLLEIVSGAGVYNMEMAMKVLVGGCGYYQTKDDYEENGHTYIIYTKGKDGNTFVFSYLENTGHDAYDTYETGWYLVSVLGNTAKVTLPDSIDAKYKKENIQITKYNIFKNAFQGNDKLKEITIPDSVEHIYEYAFQNCKNLTKVTANSVTEVGYNAFSGCENLAEIHFDELKTIRYSAFEDCKSLKNVTLNNVTSIENSAFSRCTGIEDVSLPKYIPDHMYGGIFSNCTSLKTATLDEATMIPNDMFYNCTSLTDVNAPKVYEVSFNAFNGCVLLENITFSPLTGISGCAFQNCKKLKKIIISDYLYNIGNNAFSGCESLETFDDDNCKYLESETNKYFYLFDIIDKTSDTCVISDDVRCVNIDIFNDYPALKHLTVPTEITFDNLMNILDLCQNLEFEKIDDVYYISSQTNQYLMITNVDKTKSQIQINDNSKYIYSRAFKDSNITSITIPSSIKSLGESAFENTNITELDLSSNHFEMMQGSLFKNNKLLTSAKVNYATYAMFEGCSALKTLILNNDYINGSLCKGCISLTSVTSNTSFSYVGEEAFYNCTSLTTINLRNVNEIWSRAFYNCTSLTSVDLSSLVELQDSAFYNTGLTEANLINVENISAYAFANNANLTKVTLGENLEFLGSYAFSGCSKLGDLVIPDAVQTLGENLFERCSTLASVMIPSQLITYIMSVFQGCPNMTELYYKGTYEDLRRLNIRKSDLELNQQLYLYSETEPTDRDFRYWHYNASNEKVLWPLPQA